METLRFLARQDVLAISQRFGTPVYVYDESSIRSQATAALAFPHAYGLTVRYAIKANPNAAILRLFDSMGLHFDASSGFEAWRAMKVGIAAEKISLSAQEMPTDFMELAEAGVRFVATSLRQLEVWGAERPNTNLAIRFNPGIGTGGNNRTNVGGPNASFGIWHEQSDQVHQLAETCQLTIDRIHTHIGSGGDPAVWSQAAKMTLAIVAQFESVTQLDLGGGFRVARMSGERPTDLKSIGRSVCDAIEQFADDTGRQLHLEIEPGTYLVANGGSLVATVQDVVSTGTGGHEFLRLDTGLSDFLRPALYGAQHPIVVVPVEETDEQSAYVVVGHCCESGDVLTPADGDPETIRKRTLTKATAGDLVVVEGAGAYCAAMAAANYNSFPVVPEVLRQADRNFRLIRRRQTLNEIVALEE